MIVTLAPTWSVRAPPNPMSPVAMFLENVEAWIVSVVWFQIAPPWETRPKPGGKPIA